MPRRSHTLAKRVGRLERSSRPEVKFSQGESGAFDTIGSIQGTLLLPQVLQEGVGRNQRVGDKVKSRNIRFQGICKMPDNASSSTCAVRCLVLRSKLSEPDTNDMPTWYGPVDEDKFFVVKDILTQVSMQTINNANNASASKGSTLRKFKFNVNTGLRKLQYDGASNQSPLNNEYLIYLLAENQSAEIAYNWRHYYLDN